MNNYIADVELIAPLKDIIGKIDFDDRDSVDTWRTIQCFFRSTLPHKDLQVCFHRAMVKHNQQKRHDFKLIDKRWAVGTNLEEGFHTKSSSEYIQEFGLVELLDKYPQLKKHWGEQYVPSITLMFQEFRKTCDRLIESVNLMNYVIQSIDSLLELYEIGGSIEEFKNIGILSAKLLHTFLNHYGDGGEIIRKPITAEILKTYRQYCCYQRLFQLAQCTNYLSQLKENHKKAKKQAHKLFDMLMDSDVDECLLLMFGALMKDDNERMKSEVESFTYFGVACPFMFAGVRAESVIAATNDFKYIPAQQILIMTRNIRAKLDNEVIRRVDIGVEIFIDKQTMTYVDSKPRDMSAKYFRFNGLSLPENNERTQQIAIS